MFEEVIEYTIDNINLANKTISIIREVVIKKDNTEISRMRHRCAFVPGEIEKVKEYLGTQASPEIDYLNAIWTPEVIKNYQDSLNEK